MSTKNCNLLPYREYIDDIESGKIPANIHVKNAIKRFREDLERSKEPSYPYKFEESLGQYYCDLFPKLFTHFKGSLKKQPFYLPPWQQFIIVNLFGWLQKADNLRRFRHAYIEMARKQGKTTLMAGIAVILMMMDHESSARVYSAATKVEQAKEVWNTAVKLIQHSPILRNNVRFYHNSILDKRSDSTFVPLSAEANTLDGLDVSTAVIDELHAHPSSAVWDVIDSATGNREQSLVCAITTAGFTQASFCFKLRKQMIDVLNGNNILDDWFTVIYGLDEKDCFSDESVWEKAQPNLRFIPTLLPYLRTQCKMAASSGTAMTNFLTKLMSKWVSNEQSWLDVTKWDACKSAIPFDPTSFKGRPAIIGVDLSENLDLTSICLCFMPYGDDVKWHYLWKCYLPSDTITDYINAKNDYRWREWINSEELTEIPGAKIRHDVIEADIFEWCKQFDVQMVAVDKWHFDRIAHTLQDQGITAVEIGQNFQELSNAAKEFESNIAARELVHYSDTLVRWQVQNVTVFRDNHGNIKPIKPKGDSGKNKVDSIVAAITATSAAVRVDVQAPPDYGFFIG